MNARSWCSPSSVRTRGTRGPAPDGAAPVSRASDRRVFEVPTTQSAAPAAHTRSATAATAGSIRSASAAISLLDGGSLVNESRVSRPAPSGSDSATSGSSSRPAASSSDPPPMSTTSRRPADQPNHRRAARNV